MNFHLKKFKDDTFVPASLGEYTLTKVDFFKYLGVTIASDLTWSSHVESVFLKVRKLCFFIRRLRTFKVPQHILIQFMNSCVLPIILYCSPVIFPGLLRKDFVLLRRCLKLLSRSCRASLDSIVRQVVSAHIIACKKLATRILNDVSHPLYSELSCCRSYGTTRSSFKHLHARTEKHKNSCINYLARLLTDETSTVDKLLSEFI